MNSHRFLKHNNIKEEKLQNDKLYGRNVPSFFIQPNIDFRPISTKYSYFQIEDEYAKSNEKIKILNDYDPKNVFFPGDSKPPFSYFARNVDTETDLRNQFMALQKADQAVYVPSSTSDLYNSISNVSSRNEDKEPNFYKLTDNEKYQNHSKISQFRENSLFHNNTRLSNYNIKKDKRNKN
tara:strand:- start:1749 stop:2288 length:540 start_codon:yes stop_codon:yes gene_type:complete